ncbi:hypothetical protein BYT27DRAFT_7217866 [Phlegmacium glaucopus]|nr:hypothetical protein BYT27DRAFT_7217866 [Phlegmacium glaucopus]
MAMNKLAYEDTQMSNELTVVARDSPTKLHAPSIVVAPASTETPQPSYPNNKVAQADDSNTRMAMDNESAQRITQLWNELTQEYLIIDQMLSENLMMRTKDNEKYMHAGDTHHGRFKMARDNELVHEDTQTTQDLTMCTRGSQCRMLNMCSMAEFDVRIVVTRPDGRRVEFGEGGVEELEEKLKQMVECEEPVEFSQAEAQDVDGDELGCEYMELDSAVGREKTEEVEEASNRGKEPG